MTSATGRLEGAVLPRAALAATFTETRRSSSQGHSGVPPCSSAI
jgi:hypothetical protein